MSEQKRLVIFFIVSAAILFTWQTYFAPKVPIAPSSKALEPKNQTDTINRNTNKNISKTKEVADLSKKDVSPISNDDIEVISLNNNGFIANINSFLSVVNINTDQSVFDFKDILGVTGTIGLEFFHNEQYKKQFFNLEKVDKNTLVATSPFQKFNVSLGENGFLHFVPERNTNTKFRFFISSTKKELENGQIRNYSFFAKDLDSIQVGDSEATESFLKWFGLDFNYHLISFVFEQKLASTIKSYDNGLLTVQPSVENLPAFKVIFAKKEYDYLTELGNKLNMSVDFGFWGIIAVPILRSLQFFHEYFPNYGVSIIILTIFIRMLTFPLTYKSFKSMKKMQTIQPELNKLKEKYKDEPQRMQKETMELFKRAGANPLSGCLPLLLQMPIFFAFYKVLFSSVELVDAPFILWIHDLSNKDPYYVLPFLMAVAMFLQQKLTPTAVSDPMQKKVMLFMPVIFAVIMKDMPAGLSLYIFVSTLFGIAQQFVVYKKA